MSLPPSLSLFFFSPLLDCVFAEIVSVCVSFAHISYSCHQLKRATTLKAQITK